MRTRRRSFVGFGTVLVAAVLASACTGKSSPGSGGADTSPARSTTPAAEPPTTSSPAKNSGSAGGGRTGGNRVRIAFAGDVHFAGASGAALGGDFGSATAKLKAADLAVVNLETAITTRGTPGPKKYTFRAPASAMKALRTAGIDVVTIANNHGMDYGLTGLTDTLAASRRYGLPVVGGGSDITAAYTPYRRTIDGVRVAVLGATDVLDDFASSTWPATDSQPGLASAKDPTRLLDAVRSAAASSDIVVVDLHWGVELRSCPTPRQVELAGLLTAAGADIVVGSHAHVLGPHVEQGHTAVHFGLGNFNFYARGGAASQSGVYTVTVDRGGVVDTAWTPAVIRGGRPQLLTGSAADSAAERERALAGHCDVAP
jgi:poly-gamma-glutamate capsule biosynthesis protein CapA/YwtB (metallophosphatase superfamily)